MNFCVDIFYISVLKVHSQVLYSLKWEYSHFFLKRLILNEIAKQYIESRTESCVSEKQAMIWGNGNPKQ